jgi:hypothetical protein
MRIGEICVVEKKLTEEKNRAVQENETRLPDNFLLIGQ